MTSMKTEAAKNELLMVATAESLTYLTEQGWALREVLEEDGPIESSPPRQVRDSNGFMVHEPAKFTIGKMHRYLLVKSGEAVVGALRGELEALSRINVDLNKRLLDETAKAKEATKAIEPRDAALRVQHERIAGLVEHSQKMEADLGKVRAAIGALRMKEILEGKGS